MHTAIVPETLTGFLAAFEGCFAAPSYRNFVTLMTGWVRGLGRRTVTAMVLAADAVGSRHMSVFHRFFSRARWVLDELGRVVFHLALPWLPAEGPLIVILDDTRCRKGGKGIALASMHHDPLRSTARKPFFSFGHVWVVLARWIPLPMGGTRGFTLPLRFRLYRSRKRGGQADAASRPTRGRRRQAAQAAHTQAVRATKLELAREMRAIVASWAGARSRYAVADSVYAGRTLLERRPANVQIISRLRMDAALWTPPPPDAHARPAAPGAGVCACPPRPRWRLPGGAGGPSR
jgi:SRSO17 transposase